MSDQNLIRSNASILREGSNRMVAGEKVILATVTSTWGSSPRPTGSLMILTDSGYCLGSVSGGCIEQELILLIKKEFPTDSFMLEYDAETNRSLPCGGRLSVILEPLNFIEDLTGLIEALEQGKKVRRIISVSQNSSIWSSDENLDFGGFMDDVYIVSYDAAWKVLVVGFGDLGRSVASFAQMLDYKVLVCEPREEFRKSDEASFLSISSAYPDDFIQEAECDQQTAILALTHDPKIDDLAMIQSLETEAFYIGALGSARTAEKRARRLVDHFDFSPDVISRIKAPIGIDLQTRKVNEIALAVMADVTACRNKVEIGTTRN